MQITNRGYDDDTFNDGANNDNEEIYDDGNELTKDGDADGRTQMMLFIMIMIIKVMKW
jgi:hypothetical protein